MSNTETQPTDAAGIVAEINRREQANREADQKAYRRLVHRHKQLDASEVEEVEQLLVRVGKSASAFKLDCEAAAEADELQRGIKDMECSMEPPAVIRRDKEQAQRDLEAAQAVLEDVEKRETTNKNKRRGVGEMQRQLATVQASRPDVFNVRFTGQQDQADPSN